MPDPFPDVIRLEPAGTCNFRCRHCSNGLNPHPRGLMPRELFFAIMRQFDAENFAPRVAVLYHGGETLLNPDLPEFVHILKEKGVQKIRIVTNGSLLTRNLAEKLLENGVTDLGVSFDGNSPEENNALRKNGDFLRDSANILLFLQLAAGQVSVSIVNTRICDKEEILSLAGETVRTPAFLAERFGAYADTIDILSFPAFPWPGYQSDEFEVFTVPNDNVVPGVYAKPCACAMETLTILSDGNVVPCHYDIRAHQVMGNVRDTSIFDIWHNDAYTAFRQALMDDVPTGICANCLHNVRRYLIKKKKPK